MENNLVENWQYYSFVKNSRFYTINLEKDLYENWVITLINGSIVTKMKRIRHKKCDDYETALNEVKELIAYRVNKRRYTKIR